MLRVCFGYNNEMIDEWDNPASFIPRVDETYTLKSENRLVNFRVKAVVWMEQNYVMIVLTEPVDFLTGKAVDYV